MTARVVIMSDPDFRPEECPMQFRLTYEGELLAASRDNTRAAHKQEIRAQLSPQLARLWKVNHWLKEISECHFPDYATAASGQHLKNPAFRGSPKYPEIVAKNYQAHGRRWLPIVGEDMGLTCGVEILYLRKGARGGVVQGGDIDGRLKTLFDALSIPVSGAGLPDPKPDELVHVLLSDDKHISHVAAESDELLKPTSDSTENMQHDSRVIITVTIKPLRSNYLTLGFSSF